MTETKKQLPLATFRIATDKAELWESFKAKADANKTTGAALFWQFVQSYVDSVDTGIDASVDSNIDERIDARIDVALEALRNEYDGKIDEAIALVKKPMLSVMRAKVTAA